MAEQPYKRPPITEAVIHVVFDTFLNDRDYEKVNKDFSDIYPRHRIEKNVDFGIAMPPRPDLAPAMVQQVQIGHRHNTDDETQILIIWPNSIVLSQLSPYPGWDEFFGRFTRDWGLWKKAVGYNKIARVGVRYINRIDVPVTGPVVNYEEFLTVHPHFPNELTTAVTSYGIQVQIPYPEIDGKITINSSSVPSPLLDYASFMFDQDLVKEANLPQNDEGLYKLLTEIHAKKNIVFETCITERARGLFNS